MAIPILCLVIFLQLVWIFLLKLQIERLKMEIAVKYAPHMAETLSAQKGMRSFKIGKQDVNS